MHTLLSLNILHSLEQKSLGYRCDTFSFSHSCQQPKCTTPANSTCCMGQWALNTGWEEKNPPITFYTGQKLKPVLLMRTGDEFDTQRRWEVRGKRKKTPCISMQAACKELLQKQSCYIDQIFPVLSIQFFQTEGDFLLKGGFSQSLSIPKPCVELESLCTISRDQQALYLCMQALFIQIPQRFLNPEATTTITHLLRCAFTLGLQSLEGHQFKVMYTSNYYQYQAFKSKSLYELKPEKPT